MPTKIIDCPPKFYDQNLKMAQNKPKIPSRSTRPTGGPGGGQSANRNLNLTNNKEQQQKQKMQVLQTDYSKGVANPNLFYDSQSYTGDTTSFRSNQTHNSSSNNNNTNITANTSTFTMNSNGSGDNASNYTYVKLDTQNSTNSGISTSRSAISQASTITFTNNHNINNNNQAQQNNSTLPKKLPAKFQMPPAQIHNHNHNNPAHHLNITSSICDTTADLNSTILDTQRTLQYHNDDNYSMSSPEKPILRMDSTTTNSSCQLSPRNDQKMLSGSGNSNNNFNQNFNDSDYDLHGISNANDDLTNIIKGASQKLSSMGLTFWGFGIYLCI